MENNLKSLLNNFCLFKLLFPDVAPMNRYCSLPCALASWNHLLGRVVELWHVFNCMNEMVPLIIDKNSIYYD